MVSPAIPPKISVIDVDEPTAEKEPVKRGRGRPLGSKGKPTLKLQALTVSEFSFFRALLQGVAYQKAAPRFIPERAAMSSEQVADYQRFLFASISSAGMKYLSEIDPNSQEFHALKAGIDDLTLYWTQRQNASKSETQTARAKQFSWSLEAFMSESGIEEDFYGEAELLELYEEAFNEKKAIFEKSNPTPSKSQVTSEPSKASVDSAISALGLIQSLLIVSPRPDDALAGWLSASIAQKLLPMGVETLAQLAKWINRNGKSWHKEVHSVGRKKAASITQWLYTYEEYTGIEIDRHIIASALQYLGNSSINLVEGHDSDQCVLRPLRDIQWPEALSGADGLYRSSDANTYKATNDKQAVDAWIETLRAANKNTQLVYIRAVERLVLWSLFVKGTALSSLATPDLFEFFEFLRKPPDSWIQKEPAVKGSGLWRPMRGGLSEKSLELNVQAVKRMFSAWFNANYIMANAAKDAGYQKRQAATMDVMRSFTIQDLAYVKRTLDGMPPGPAQNRQKALMMLLLTTGLRAREFINQKWKYVKQARVGLNSTSDYVISVVGKGGKERILPIRSDVYNALKVHLEDRKLLTKTEKLSSFARFSDEEWPLIGIIDETKAQESDGTESDYSYDCARKGNTDGTISYERFKNVVTSFFKRCADLCDSEGHDSTRLRQATPHWMRHTFAHVVLDATDRDLVVVQSLLGHSDLSTTGLYVKADVEKRVESVKNMPTFL